MKVLIIGSGGREHALAWKLAQSSGAEVVFTSVAAAAGGNVKLNLFDMSAPDKALAFCKDNAVGLVVIGPEAPLEQGLADALRKGGLKVFGPGRAGAKLEWSKDYSKAFMQKFNIPTAAYKSFTEAAAALEYIKTIDMPAVVKADGLAAGKGVIICQTKEEAASAVLDLMQKQAFGAAGAKVVIEEFLEGREASIMAFVDGDNYKLLPISRDHKRLLDGDKGPNTGGMGVYSPVPDIEELDLEFIAANIFDNVIVGLKAEKIDFCGLLYAGIMKGPRGINVLEFNTRFGDPETQTILPLIEQDLLDVMLACADKRLNDIDVTARAQSGVCVTLAGGDYPKTSSKGVQILGLENVKD
ncbi:MAG: phosphoribosylamine--glycine ligase, partial [Elusimicrobiota bacterium]|nr:phosphoribosylamine--glycine ligase [Elusimicrobiota bacterium]